MTTDGAAVFQQVAEDLAQGRLVDAEREGIAVRWSLRELAKRAPGRSVEVRIPPYGAVQVITGTTHRRGTPSAVVQTDGSTWLALAAGRLTWAQAEASGNLQASGERSDLSGHLPLTNASSR